MIYNVIWWFYWVNSHVRWMNYTNKSSQVTTMHTTYFNWLTQKLWKFIQFIMIYINYCFQLLIQFYFLFKIPSYFNSTYVDRIYWNILYGTRKYRQIDNKCKFVGIIIIYFIFTYCISTYLYKIVLSIIKYNLARVLLLINHFFYANYK